MINNRYTILHKLGESRSQVFCCLDKYYPGEKFAIKILSNDDISEKELFVNEYLTLQKINHPYIIKAAGTGTALYADQNEFESFGITPGSRFFVMEYFEGQKVTEAAWIKTNEYLTEVISQICSVLLYLHNSNFIYSDLKAENVLVRKNGNNPEIKFIDFGLSVNVSEENQRPVTGTFHYLSPEVLQGNDANHLSDLFSLGVLLYRIMYEQFPFEGETESEILKSIINNEAVFPSTDFSDSIVSIVRKLLLKETNARYQYADEILKEVNKGEFNQILKQGSPAKVIVDTLEKDQISEYLNDHTRPEILFLQGPEGSGKTTLLEALASENQELVYISHTENLLSEKRLLEQLVFHPQINSHLEKETLQSVLSFINQAPTPGTDIFDEVKLMLIKINSDTPFKIIFDDFNRYETKTKVSLIELVQILQSKKSKVIIACDSTDKMLEDSIYNFLSIHIQPFSSNQIDLLIRKSIPPFFPLKEISRLLNDYWNLTPGGIYEFLKSLYENEAIEINSGRASIKEGYQVPGAEENYAAILKTFSGNEERLIEVCSIINRNVQGQIYADILRISKDDITLIISRLQRRGILRLLPENQEITFMSDRFRQYVYSGISNKNIMHVYVAEYFERTGNAIYNDEIAFQYEKSGNYEKCFDISWKTILLPENNNALRYQKEVLLKLSQFPVQKEKKIKARLQLCKVLQKLNEYKLCLDLIRDYQTEDLDYQTISSFIILSGISMIESGETEPGKQLLENTIAQLTDKKEILASMLYLAYAHLDLGLFEQALEKCRNLIEHSEEFYEYSAKGHNLLGLIVLQYKNDLIDALKEFEAALDLFKMAELPVNIAAAEVNIGNILSMQGNLDKAEQHWKNSLSINSSIGNLNQEAKLLLNLGIFYFEKSEFQQAIRHYNEAQFIFSNIGDIFSAGLCFTNLGELNIVISRYTDALRSLMEAKKIFTNLNSISELIELEFLFGKCCFNIGDIQELNTVLKNLSGLVKEKSVNEKYREYLRFLQGAKKKLSGNIKGQVETLKSMKEVFYSMSDWNNFITVNLLLSEILISMKCYTEGLEELNDERFMRMIILKVYANAEKELLLSLISTHTENLGVSNRFELLNNSYSLIEDQEINEVTWKVLYYLAEAYYDRGNVNKAKLMANYAEKSLKYIADLIKDEVIRKKYLSLPERKKVLQRIEFIQRQL